MMAFATAAIAVFLIVIATAEGQRSVLDQAKQQGTEHILVAETMAILHVCIGKCKLCK